MPRLHPAHSPKVSANKIKNQRNLKSNSCVDPILIKFEKMEYFDFIADQKFKNLLSRDFLELEACVSNKASKSVLILSGSIIEATLIEYFTHNLPTGKTKTQVLKMGLADLINEAENIGLISSRSKELSTVVRNYRNLIHPGREIRKNEQFDNETAIVSYSLVKIILKEIKENYLKKYGYRAEDVFNKITVDSSTYSIYEKLLTKLNHHEQVRLMNMLVEFQVESFGQESKVNYEKYINPLKPLIGNDKLLLLCKELVSKVEKGKNSQILALFEIFGYNLNLLDTEEQELVLTYIYNIANRISPWNNSVTDYSFRELFSFFGLYLNTPLLKEKFFNLLLNIVKSHNSASDNKWAYLSAYRNLVSKLSADKIDKCADFIAEKLSEETKREFFEALENDDELPF